MSGEDINYVGSIVMIFIVFVFPLWLVITWTALEVVRAIFGDDIGR